VTSEKAQEKMRSECNHQNQERSKSSCPTIARLSSPSISPPTSLISAVFFSLLWSACAAFVLPTLSPPTASEPIPMSGQNQHDSSPFLIVPSVQQKGHAISTTSTDAEPVLFAADSSPTLRRCQVCHDNQARYTCPKCELPYCSVQCYQTHNNDQNKNDAAGGSSSSCTESFYKDRVSQVLQLEVKEKKGDMQQILTRIHNQQQGQHQYADDALSRSTDTRRMIDDDSRLSQDELVQLLSILEKSQEDDEKLERLMSSLPGRVQKAVQGILRDAGGNASNLQDWILEDWHPSSL